MFLCWLGAQCPPCSPTLAPTIVQSEYLGHGGLRDAHPLPAEHWGAHHQQCSQRVTAGSHKPGSQSPQLEAELRGHADP